MSENNYEDIKKEVMEDLTTNAKYEVFRQRFIEEQTLNSFYNSYSLQKARILCYGAFYYQQEQAYHKKLEKDGWEFLSLILQKKLFDIQCLWRAEKVILPKIELSIQFKIWEERIAINPFTAPITPQEVEVLKSFVVKHNNLSIDLNSIEWQEYPRQEYVYGIESPWTSWYDYYNKLMGMPNFWTIYSNVRGKKESGYDAYKNGWVDEDQDDQDDQLFDNQYYPKYGGCDNEAIEEFINRFEGPALHDFKKAYDSNSTILNWDSDYQMALDLLTMNDVNMPVKANPVWYNGIVEVASSFYNQELCKAIDKAFGQYQNNQKFPVKEKQVLWENMFQQERERIIKVRLKRGEPGDLNF